MRVEVEVPGKKTPSYDGEGNSGRELTVFCFLLTQDCSLISPETKAVALSSATLKELIIISITLGVLIFMHLHNIALGF